MPTVMGGGQVTRRCGRLPRRRYSERGLALPLGAESRYPRAVISRKTNGSALMQVVSGPRVSERTAAGLGGMGQLEESAGGVTTLLGQGRVPGGVALDELADLVADGGVFRGSSDARPPQDVGIDG